MPDTYLTIDALNRLMQSLTIQALGIQFADSNDKTPYEKVRVAWPIEGMPAFAIDEDVSILRCVEVDNSYNRKRFVVDTNFDNTNLTQTTYYTRVMEIFWIFYGPNSFDHAQSLRDALFYQQYHDFLAASQVYLMPDVSAPRRLPELFQGRWWERVDFNAHFYELISRDIKVPWIAEVPITVKEENGNQQSLDIVVSI